MLGHSRRFPFEGVQGNKLAFVRFLLRLPPKLWDGSFRCANLDPPKSVETRCMMIGIRQ